MSEWKEYRLADFANINPTERLQKGTIAKKIAMEVVQPFTKKIPMYSNEEYKGGVKFKNGDTIMARITPSLENGKTSYVDILDDGAIGFGSTEFIVFREKEDISDKHFVYYLTTSPIIRNTAIKSMTGNSGRQRVQTEVLKEHLFDAPELPEQKAIAEVLSSLDDKIDLLHRQNKTLEQMAETLFRQWFLPVRDRTQTDVEEAKEDWEVGVLGDIINFNPIYRIPKGESAPYLEMKNVNISTFNPKDWYYRDFTSGMKFQNGDTIMARITPCLENGKTSFIYFLEKEQVGLGSTEYIVMHMKQPFHKFISYLVAKDNDFRDFTISSMSGSSGRQRAQANTIKKYEIKIPPSDVVERLNEQIESIVEKLQYNAFQIPTLEKIRDTLLPKLMSGEVKVL